MIVPKNENVTLVNALALKRGQTLLNQGSGDSLPAVGLADRQVVDVTAPAVVPAQYHPCQLKAIKPPNIFILLRKDIFNLTNFLSDCLDMPQALASADDRWQMLMRTAPVLK